MRKSGISWLALILMVMSSLVLCGCVTVALQGEYSGLDNPAQNLPQPSLCPLPTELKPIAGNEVGSGQVPDVLPLYPGTVRISLFEPPE